MDDELVKELRGEYGYDTRKYIRVMKAAADAIEELSAYVQMLEELRKDGWYLQKTKMMTYGQAIMIRPLPEPPKEGK